MTMRIPRFPKMLRSSFDDLLKELLFARLRTLEEGTLVIEDPRGRYQFGRSAPASSSTVSSPEADAALSARVTIEDPRAYRYMVLGGSVGAAEAYMDGYWSCDDLVSLLRLFTRNHDAVDLLDDAMAWLPRLRYRWQHRARKNTQAGSRRNIYSHYDLGNDFFALFLDDTMTYSCGVFETLRDPSGDSSGAALREASIAKLDRICRKLQLTPGDRVLEIGAGWGSFAIHAASHYGCHVTTTTISEQQYALAQERIRARGLDERITLLLDDYRDLGGSYDKLVSIEMIEAVGHEYLDGFFRVCSERLRPHGRMLLQAITIRDQHHDQARREVDFIRQHVFPGTDIPSITTMLTSVTRATDMRLVHLEDITPHYAKTLACWRERFHAHLDQVRALGHDERFIRLWDYYLAYCEAGFSERYIGDVQMLLAKPRSRSAPILGRLDATLAP